MTSFETNGFLSDEISGFEEDIRNRYKEKFELASEVNILGHKIIYSIEVHTNINDLLMATLLIRQSASFQAFLLLIQKGLLAQSEIILRNIS